MTDGKNSHCYSGGEVVITTINNSDEVVTQGFQQPNDIEEQLVLDIVNGLISDDPDNNKFVITNISEYPDNRVVVLNRWGILSSRQLLIIMTGTVPIMVILYRQLPTTTSST
jgi:hypothetical protein